MNHYIYAFKNKVAEFYSKPWTSGEDPETCKTHIGRSILTADVRQLDSLSDDDLYYLGYFDDETGKIVPNNEFLLDASAMVKQARILRVESDDGKQEEN